MLNLNLIKKRNFYIILIILIGILFRFFYFLNVDGWFDEWNMLYTIDPSVSNEDTWKRYYGDRGDHNLPEYYPPLNAFLLKYIFTFFEYNIENTRLISLFFGCGSLVLVFYLSRIFSNFNYSLISTTLVAFNLFLIWQSSEIRPHSFVVFFSLLSIILFIKIQNQSFNECKATYFIYLLSSLILLSSWPFTLIIFFAKFIFLAQDFFDKKKINTSILLVIFLSLFLYVILNLDYLLYHLSRDEHYTKLYLAFFYSFHFRSFFGSIYLGAIFLILFSLLLIFNYKNIFFKSQKDNILIFIILSSYFLTISYSIIGASVISPKYIIFILPLIIIWSVYKIEVSKFKFKDHLLISILFLTILNFFINFKNNPIDRPPTKEMLEVIASSNIKAIYTPETIVFNHFVSTHKIFKKNNLRIDKAENIDSYKGPFWFLCVNNARFALGDNNLPEQDKCKYFEKGDIYSLKREIKVTDYILRKYEN